MNSTTRDRNYDLNHQRQRLEGLVAPATPGRSLTSLLFQLGERTMKFLTQGNELRIWQRTRNGRPTWFAYDPVTNRTRSFYAEADLRHWLDQRYYD
jgi:hypothetical protein